MKAIDIEYNEEEISSMSHEQFTKRVKEKAFVALRAVQEGHAQVKHIYFSGLIKHQGYMVDRKFNHWLSSLLYNLRC